MSWLNELVKKAVGYFIKEDGGYILTIDRFRLVIGREWTNENK